MQFDAIRVVAIRPTVVPHFVQEQTSLDILKSLKSFRSNLSEVSDLPQIFKYSFIHGQSPNWSYKTVRYPLGFGGMGVV